MVIELARSLNSTAIIVNQFKKVQLRDKCEQYIDRIKQWITLEKWYDRFSWPELSESMTWTERFPSANAVGTSRSNFRTSSMCGMISPGVIMVDAESAKMSVSKTNETRAPRGAIEG
jgi:hypothetical protein